MFSRHSAGAPHRSRRGLERRRLRRIDRNRAAATPVFAGVGSPLTHAIGLGLNGLVAAAEFDRMEEFYKSRGSPINLDLYPHADWSMFELVAARGYRIVECNNVLVGPVDRQPGRARAHRG